MFSIKRVNAYITAKILILRKKGLKKPFRLLYSKENMTAINKHKTTPIYHDKISIFQLPQYYLEKFCSLIFVIFLREYSF